MHITTPAILAILASLINAQSIDIPIPNDPTLIDVQALSSHDSVNLASSAMVSEVAIDEPIPQEQVTTSTKKILLYYGIHLPMAMEATTTPYSPMNTAAAPGATYWRAPQTSAGQFMPAMTTPVITSCCRPY